MALRKLKSDVPKNAIILNESEAKYYQWEQLRNWKNIWDVWPIFYGVPAMAFFAGLSGLRINNHYRLKLKLRRYGKASTSLAIGLTPVVFTIAPHYMIVTEELFIDKPCPVCLYTRAIGIQIFTSTIYPMMMSPIANFMFSVRHGTYPLPYWSDYKDIFKLLFTLHKSLAPKMKVMLPMQVVVASLITYMQSRNLHNIKDKIERGEVDALPQILI